MKNQKRVYDMTDRELRAYKRKRRKQLILRRRITFCAITLCLVTLLTLSVHAFSSSANTGKDELKFKYYTNIEVKYGETLWSIAEDYMDGQEYKNIAAYIEEVASINHMQADTTIKAGQTLIVPYYSAEFVK